MFKTLVATASSMLLACANAASEAADAGDESSACLACVDAGTDPPWTNPSAPLGVRMATMLHDCTGAEACHATGTGGMTIASGDEFAQLIRVRSTERPELYRVAPGDPSGSYLYLKLAGDGGITGARMPASADFDPRRPALAWTWIEAGAPRP
jgi:hypothetical protein